MGACAVTGALRECSNVGRWVGGWVNKSVEDEGLLREGKEEVSE